MSILPVRVFVGETTSDSYVAAGLKYAIESGADVINMSLGGSCVCGADGSCGSPIDYYVTEAWNSGIVVVVAAGNGDENGVPEDTAVCCPAHMTDCIVVSACDSTGKLGSFSNYGDTVDVCAPGVEVLSYYPGDVLAALDGTSMAAPHISALAAMLKLYLPDKTPEQIEKYIGDYCTDMGDPAGYGEGHPLGWVFCRGLSRKIWGEGKMTDNDLRKSRHWRCSQCGSSWPLDMAVCGNPACGADLGIYGQVIEPEPERAPEPEKQPEDAKKVPRPEEEKPRGDEKGKSSAKSLTARRKSVKRARSGRGRKRPKRPAAVLQVRSASRAASCCVCRTSICCLCS
mgnify:CR=1 FL=1